ncbi:hypothetical protein HY502_04030 [Candidatus Woesebacteria bacterium]|nr:hypothetical protein [Candidatus Woesebacteria bacterium]
MKEAFVRSDIDALKEVIVQPLGSEAKHVLPNFGAIGLPGFTEDIFGDAATSQHEKFAEVFT